MSEHPPADVDIDACLVSDLLTQSPKHARLPAVRTAHGWDNEIWRLGDDLAVRLPRRAIAGALLRNEARWLPRIAGLLPVPVPAAVFVGRPSGRYPYPWAIVPWLPGSPATGLRPEDRDRYAEQLAQILKALHVEAPAEAPANPFRGCPIADRSDAATARLAGHRHERQLAMLLADAVDAAPYAGVPCWLHGDPHPYNVLVEHAAISALIDFGDLTAGDPAGDLAVAWLHFTRPGRERFFSAYGADEPTLRRARGWAVSYASFMIRLEQAHPLHACGEHAIDALIAEA